MFVGQLLSVPDLSSPAEQPAAASTPGTIPTAQPGETSVAAKTSGSSEDETPGYHTVQANETLTGIARRYGMSAEALKELNDIGDADFIVIGQQLRISAAATEPALPAVQEATPSMTPDAEATPAADTATSTVTETPVATETATITATSTPVEIPDSYTVQAGETLSGIAKRYSLALAVLKALNGIEDENAIYEGQELRLVAATPSPERTEVATATPTEQVDATEAGRHGSCSGYAN